MSMRFEHFQGSHRAIGRQRGEAFRDLLRQYHQRYDSWPADFRQRLDSLIPTFESALGRSAPELIEEMQGTAEGAEIPYEDILRFNFAEEVGVPSGCSQVALVDANGDAILGKSEDAGFERTYVVTELRPERGYGQLHVSAVNWVIGSGGGLNEAGLCIGQSSLYVTDQAHGIPRLMLLRLALERCANVTEAIAFLQSQDMALRGMNFLLVDANGDMAVVERSPTHCAVRRAEGGVIWATNHALSPLMRAVEEGSSGTEPDIETRLAVYVNSRQRFARLCDFATSHSGKADVKEALDGFLRSHGPGGLCQHGIMDTTLSMIMIARTRQLWATDGPPCSSSFQLYSLAPPK